MIMGLDGVGWDSCLSFPSNFFMSPSEGPQYIVDFSFSLPIMQSWKVDLWSHKELLHKQLEHMWGHHFLITLWELIVCLIGWIICTSIVHASLGLGFVPLRILHDMEYTTEHKWVDSFYCIMFVLMKF